jgi:uncharacterized protein YjaG (DUF416 family)
MNISLKPLSQWQQITFCAALLERMLPNYQLFSEGADFGEFKVLRNQLDLIWQWLDKNNKCKINYGAQLNKLEEQTPNPELFDVFGVFPALDVCMAMMSLLQGMQDNDKQDIENVENVARLSQNSVSYFVELTLAQAYEQDDEIVIAESDINDHPLMVWEQATQEELFDYLTKAPENKATCVSVKAMVLEEGLSNIGIEIA